MSTSTDRQRKSRASLTQRGGKQLSVRLTADATDKLHSIMRITRRNMTQSIESAINYAAAFLSKTDLKSKGENHVN